MKPTRRQRKQAYLRSSRKKLTLSYEEKGRKGMSSIWVSGQPRLTQKDADFIVHLINNPPPATPTMVEARERLKALAHSEF